MNDEDRDESTGEEDIGRPAGDPGDSGNSRGDGSGVDAWAAEHGDRAVPMEPKKVQRRGFVPIVGRVAHLGALFCQGKPDVDACQTQAAYNAALSHFTKHGVPTAAGLANALDDALMPGKGNYIHRPDSVSPFVHHSLKGMWLGKNTKHEALEKYGPTGEMLGYCYAGGLALTMERAAVVGRGMASVLYTEQDTLNLGSLISILGHHCFLDCMPRVFAPSDHDLPLPDWFKDSPVWHSFEEGFTCMDKAFAGTAVDTARFLGAACAGNLTLDADTPPLLGLVTLVEDRTDLDLRCSLEAATVVERLYPKRHPSAEMVLE